MLCCKRHTNYQVKSLIGYIVHDGMTLLEALVKANVCEDTVSKYYRQYVDDPDNNIPTPENKNRRTYTKQRTLTFDQVKIFFCSIIIDKLNVSLASRKAGILQHVGRKLYKTYLQNPTQVTEIKDMSYSVEKMERFVKLVENKSMSLKKSSRNSTFEHHYRPQTLPKVFEELSI